LQEHQRGRKAFPEAGREEQAAADRSDLSEDPRQLFNTILGEEGVKKDREGQPRTAYSLRHTYICLRLMVGADIYQIAKNCRTSVEMIEKYYASHLKNSLAAAAINLRRKKAKKNEPPIEPEE
jgi:integrase